MASSDKTLAAERSHGDSGSSGQDLTKLGRGVDGFRVDAARRAQPALSVGSYHPIAAEGDLILYTREYGENRILVSLNLGADPATVRLSHRVKGRVLVSCLADRDGEAVDGEIELRPDEGLVISHSREAANCCASRWGATAVDASRCAQYGGLPRGSRAGPRASDRSVVSREDWWGAFCPHRPQRPQRMPLQAREMRSIPRTCRLTARSGVRRSRSAALPLA
jgi:hypothetical protein